ncbi:hypothetical protein HGM15179_020564 [Zosterops borbonicus]|uniref:Uncharacterized protein n=1 Tax=Zosterops borbonicus TaxID=364589 RepID=A0A8K1D7B5_9PASS|nr:hypothetical protein HGM15179_020564 [Zosterops borbonicus]
MTREEAGSATRKCCGEKPEVEHGKCTRTGNRKWNPEVEPEVTPEQYNTGNATPRNRKPEVNPGSGTSINRKPEVKPGSHTDDISDKNRKWNAGSATTIYRKEEVNSGSYPRAKPEVTHGKCPKRPNRKQEVKPGSDTKIFQTKAGSENPEVTFQ